MGLLQKLLIELRPSFSWWNSELELGQELRGGLIGAILVIPQGVTFSYLVGVPPEHGIYCAIFITLLASLFGNSTMMSGPNTATSILIGSSVLPFAGSGSPLFIDYVMMLSFMVGVIQLLAWLLRGAKIFKYITSPAIGGLTMGVGLLIIISSLDGILGLSPFKTNFFFEKLEVIFLEAGTLINFYSLSIGLITIFAGLISIRRWPKNYHLMAIFIGVLYALFINTLWPQHITEVDYLGHLDIGLHFTTPKFYADYLTGAIQLIPAAFSIAFISLAQSLVIARDLKMQSPDSKLLLNKEVLAIGLANLVGSFFLSFAGSGSFNRTQVNQEMKVQTPLSGIVTGIIVFLIVFSIGGLFRFLPMPVISGVLFIVGLRMIKWNKIKAFSNQSFHFFTFMAVILSVIFLGLTQAIAVAIVLSIYAALEEKSLEKEV